MAQMNYSIDPADKHYISARSERCFRKPRKFTSEEWSAIFDQDWPARLRRLLEEIREADKAEIPTSELVSFNSLPDHSMINLILRRANLPYRLYPIFATHEPLTRSSFGTCIIEW